jgi:four helix bundle protein
MKLTFRAMTSAVTCYRDLKVWRAAMRLALDCYQLTRHFPKDELYGLTSQIRRAAVSIPSNIAEGHGRLHRGDYVRSLSVAIGSVQELETEMMLARRLGYSTAEETRDAAQLADEVGRMLGALTRRLRRLPSP